MYPLVVRTFVAAILLGGIAAPQNLDFEARRDNPTGHAISAFAAADLDGDGTPEVIAVDGVMNKLTLLRPSGGAGLRVTATRSLVGGPAALAVGDLDADGKADLVVALRESNRIAVMPGMAASLLGEPVMYPAGSSPAALAIADLNGDGMADIAVANAGSGDVSLFFGSGGGGFRIGPSLSAGSAPSAIVAADFNRDGRMDLAVANQSSGSILVHLGSGAGAFASPRAIVIASPKYLVTADFNRDGKSDLLASNGSDTLTLFAGIGDGNFDDGATLSTDSGGALHAADVNLDGYPDLIQGGYGRITVRVSNAGSLAVSERFYALNDVTAIPATADVDGDGKLDLLAAAPSFGVISVFRGTGDGAFEQAVLLNEGFAKLVNQGLALGDFNGDGALDIAYPMTNNVQVRITYGRSWTRAVSVALSGGLGAMAAADFDGDGRADLVVAGTDGSSVSVVRGGGTLATGLPALPIANAIRLLIPADFNNDGRPDLAVATVSNDVYVYRNDGRGNLVAPTMVPVASPMPYESQLAAADLNRDGNLDLIGVGQNLSVALGKGDGTFQEPRIAASFGARNLAVADLNNDGVPDLVATTSPYDSMFSPYVALGIGDGTFAARLPLGGRQAIQRMNPVIADFNLDGKPDLATLYSDGPSSGVLIYAGRGDGTFEEPQRYGGMGGYWLLAGDLDGNRTPDLVTSGGLAGISSAWLFTVRNTTNSGADGCNYALQSLPPFPAAGAALNVSLTTGPNCRWIAAVSAPWAIVSPGSGQGAAVLTVVAQPNRGLLTRSGNLTVGSTPRAGAATLIQAGSPQCQPGVSSSGFTVPREGTARLNLDIDAGPCAWTAAANVDWIGFIGPRSSTGPFSLALSIAPNPTGQARLGSVTINDLTVSILQPGGAETSGLRFVPVRACRILDTRYGSGKFGAFGPSFVQGRRDIPILQSDCGIPPDARAYSLNLTAVPYAGLAFLTAWPQGQPQPLASNLNSPRGNIVANAAIVPAGAGGGISVFASDPVELILDVNGYFTNSTAPAALSFSPLTPCRVLDTRTNPPSLATGGNQRTVSLLTTPCNVPANAAAYSLNITAVPRGRLGYLSVWPTGQLQPLVSTLNSWDGAVTANAAIVPAGVAGAIDLFALMENGTGDVVVDINGYFAPPSATGLSFYPLTPCRAVDTRAGEGRTGPLGPPPLDPGVPRDLPLPASVCPLPAVPPAAYALNATVVPTGYLGYLSLWPTGQSRPVASTVNSLDGRIVANAALVPAGSQGSISAYADALAQTHLILDLFGYFAP